MSRPIVSKINQGGTIYDIYDESALHSIDDVELPGGDGLEITSHKVTSISEYSTDVQYPSAKAVWDLFTSIFDFNEVEF